MTKVLMKGNEAVGKAAMEAGCRFFFGYPITPQSEVPEYLSRELPKIGGRLCSPNPRWQLSIWFTVRQEQAHGL